MTPEERWDGPIQDAIRRHDEALGHQPPAVQPVSPVLFFQPPVRPNGGTVYVRPPGSGNPYAGIAEEASQPVVTVELPPALEDES